MNVFAKFDEIPSKTLQDIKETKRHGHTFVCSFVRTYGQRESSIPSHKHSLQGYNNKAFTVVRQNLIYCNPPDTFKCS